MTRSISRAEIARYFNAHRERYADEPQSFVDAVIVKTRQQRRLVAAEFRKGRTSRELVRRFAGQGTRRAFGGHLENTAFSHNYALYDAARPLGKGEVGIVEDPRGWYVFRVVETLPRREMTLEEATTQVIDDLQVRDMQQRYRTLDSQLRDRYQRDTICANGHDVPECR
jgi:hypothetical protein